jgi:hypothetical protein
MDEFSFINILGDIKMIINPYATHGNFGYIGGLVGSRPATSLGVSVAVGTTANTMGSWVEVVAPASVQYDCYRMTIIFRNASSSGVSRNILADIGIDPAGGSSYSVLIPYLGAHCAVLGSALAGGVYYTFPLFVPAGSSIACRAQGSSGGTYSITGVQVILYGQPSNPEGLIYGHAVETLGVNTGTSIGTAITIGTTSKGGWTSVGTTTKRWKSTQVSYGANTGTITANTGRMEVGFGDGTNMVITQPDVFWGASTSEQISLVNEYTECDIPVGASIYARGTCSGTAQASSHVAVYGVY